MLFVSHLKKQHGIKQEQQKKQEQKQKQNRKKTCQLHLLRT